MILLWPPLVRGFVILLFQLCLGLLRLFVFCCDLFDRGFSEGMTNFSSLQVKELPPKTSEYPYFELTGPLGQVGGLRVKSTLDGLITGLVIGLTNSQIAIAGRPVIHLSSLFVFPLSPLPILAFLPMLNRVTSNSFSQYVKRPLFLGSTWSRRPANSLQ